MHDFKSNMNISKQSKHYEKALYINFSMITPCHAQIYVKIIEHHIHNL